MTLCGLQTLRGFCYTVGAAIELRGMSCAEDFFLFVRSESCLSTPFLGTQRCSRRARVGRKALLLRLFATELA